jgi:hypothetical protein
MSDHGGSCHHDTTVDDPLGLIVDELKMVRRDQDHVMQMMHGWMKRVRRCGKVGKKDAYECVLAHQLR